MGDDRPDIVGDYTEPGSGGGSSDSGSSSSSGSGGGSSSSSAPEPKTAAQKLAEAQAKKAIQNAIATYKNLLVGWGVVVDASVMKFIERAVTSGLNSAAFMAAFRQTKAYAKTFPGIMRNDGTMRMTEAQYISGYQAARDYAASVGRNWSQAAYAQALKNGNSPTEMKQKIEAEDILKSNPGLFQEFSDYLVAQGITKKPLERAELRQFILKQGPKEFTMAFQTAQEAGLLAQYGIDVGKPSGGGDVSYKELKQLQGSLLPGQTVDVQALASAAAALPASRLYGLGITEKDIATLAYKGKHWQAIAGRVQLAIGTAREAATEVRANPELTRQGQYQGTPQVQATE
jgi:hypothetical protein